MWNENHHWTMECWEVTGTTLGFNQKSVVMYAKNKEGYVKEENIVKEERPRKKARKETTVKAKKSSREAEKSPREAEEAPVSWITQEVFEKEMKHMADAMRDGFGMILREIKHVADRVEVVAERVEALEQLLPKAPKGLLLMRLLTPLLNCLNARMNSELVPLRQKKSGRTSKKYKDLPDDLLEKTSWKSSGKSSHQTTYGKSSGKSSHQTTYRKSPEVRETKEAEEANASKEAEEASAAKEAEETNASKEAEEANAAKEAEEANTAKAAKAAKAVKAAKETNAAKAAKEAKALKEAKTAKALKETKASKALKEAKAAKEVRDAKSAEDAKAAKEAREAKVAKEARDAKEDKEVKEAKEDEESKASEGSIVIMDKQKPTASDLETEEARRLAKSEAGLANGNNTAKNIIPNKKIGCGYDPFALPVKKHITSALTNWFKKDRWYKTPPKKKAPRCPSLWYWTLRTPLEWLTDSHMDAFINVLRKRYTNDPHMFRSEIMCILHHVFAQWWMSKYPDWVSSELDANGLGRRLPGGGGFIRRRSRSGNGTFVNMVHYLLVECAATIEERCKYSLEPFTYEIANAPQCESGDCGLFALKYIECHALGFPFPGSLNPKNSKAIREKMAVNIFEEIPDAHQTEITDVDVNQDM
ncbi:hypothetical protein N665_0158s0010 [Sinapis alba]|nr:hypothetical protein N665_0158s0010 [Sinapis alba]